MGLVHTMKGDGMADYKKTAEGVLAAIGGAANVAFANAHIALCDAP